MKEEIKERLIKHLRFLEEEIRDYPYFKELTWEDYRMDNIKRRNIERWIENLVNSSIDLSKLIITAEEILLPETYREMVLSLSLIEGFDKEGIKKISQWVKLRNIVAHEYLDIRWSSINGFASKSEPFYTGFAKSVSSYIKKQLRLD
jgi:uncharacterized protein YutE (UPF0331/DUF86 family)